MRNLLAPVPSDAQHIGQGRLLWCSSELMTVPSNDDQQAPEAMALTQKTRDHRRRTVSSVYMRQKTEDWVASGIRKDMPVGWRRWKWRIAQCRPDG